MFLGADTVWKLKKAVRLPFLDFTRVADRHRFCERELVLNAPAAPGLYRDVVPIVRTRAGLAVGGEGEIVDWVVRMARVPAADFLDVRADSEGLTPRLLDKIADAVAAYHRALPPLTDTRPDMAWIAEGNRTSALAAGLTPARVEAWYEAARTALTTTEAWREARGRDGFVRRCHGDLHLGNLCLWHGAPVPFDALEFDERMARIDVAYDLAFLLMDLDIHRDRAAANRVMNRYVARTADADLVRGLPLFLSMRAMVRAHVEARSGHPAKAEPYLRAALEYLTPKPPVVIAIGGLPGAGKSTLARALAPALGVAPGALICRSDEIRKRQHKAAPEDRLPPRAYHPEKSVAVFAELAAEVETAAKAGHAAIADATFMNLDHRALIEAAAARAGVPFIGLWLTAPQAVLEARVIARSGDASDATLEVLRGAIKGDPGAGAWRAVDASDDQAAATLARTLPRSYIVF